MNCLNKVLKLLVAIYCLYGSKSYAETLDTSCVPFDCCRPDGHAPLGIMTDHIHGKGQWTVSYTYMNMMMQGNVIGTSKIDDSKIYQDYMMAPDKMIMQMHMVMAMYGITDRLTVMGMFSYIQNSMSMNMTPNTSMMMNMPGMNMGTMSPDQMNAMMNTKTSGLGDTKLYGLYKIIDKNRQRIILSAGLSIPTGSITEKGTTLLGDNQILAYPMQIGTGTYNLMPGITYVGQKYFFSWGGTTNANIKMGTNSEGYAWGNEYNVSGWVSYKWCRWISNSIRLEGSSTDQMSGYDKNIALLMNNDPNSNANNYGGQRANAYLGMNFYKDKCSLKGGRLSIEYGIPIYQNLNGPQMSLKSSLMAGWLHTF